MTRLTVGLRALLAALLCAAPFCAPPHAATVPLLLHERGGLPTFDTSYYLIFAPQTSPYLLRQNLLIHRRLLLVFPRKRSALPVPRGLPARIMLADFVLPGATADPSAATLRHITDRRAVRRISQYPLYRGALPLSFGTSPLFQPTSSATTPGTNVVLAQQSPSPVPLPAGVWLLGSALAFGVFIHRRKA